jgi:hypothetical protein
MKAIQLLVVATLALSSAGAVAQSGATSAAKPSPYEGVAQPPVSDVIMSSEEAPAPPKVEEKPLAPLSPAATPAPAAKPAPAPAPADPDAGIVEAPVTESPVTESPAVDPPASQATGSALDSPASAILHTRPGFNPDEEIVTEVETKANELPEGTPIHAKLDQEISSREDGIGTRFTAHVSQDVTQNGRVLIPLGSVLHGRVTYADYGRRITGLAKLRLSPDEIVLPDGTQYVLHAMVSQTPHSSDTKVSAEGTVESKDHPKKMAAEYAIGAGGGAAMGAVAGGPVGAIVGTAVGFGIITTHLLVQNQVAVLPANSEIIFGLTRPMMLTPITTAARK